MIVPSYWHEVSDKREVLGKKVTAKRFGWSDISKIDAEQVANQRLDEAFNALRNGETVHLRDIRVPYSGSDGVPIREEVIQKTGNIVITRNSYGALCLNTPNVLFTDVDTYKESGPALTLTCGIIIFGTALMVILAMITGSKLWAYLILAVFLLAPLVSRIVDKFQKNHLVTNMWDQINKYVTTDPQWACRIYETPNGYRLMVTHSTFDPLSEEAIDFMNIIKSDHIYVNMCKMQNCFRARVSPKPWRVGIPNHMKPVGVWPIPKDRIVDRQAWVDNYNKSIINYSSCRLIKEVGSGRVCDAARTVIDLHDKLSQSNSDMPIA
jgi:hypothetical protein